MTPHRLLVLDASGPLATATLFDGDTVLDARSETGGRGPAAVVPVLVRDVLAEHGMPDAVAVVAGPGGFTGLRATLALAAGLADGRGIPAIAVSVPEALALGQPGDRPIWCAQAARADLIYLTRDGDSTALPLDALPVPAGPVAVTGDAAGRVVAALAARGFDVRLTNARRPTAAAVAAVARARAIGKLPPLPLAPIYAEPPRVRPALVRAAPH
jgi:tRNA threonylcarbamoyladenosine biosynthesis protein TsaB